MYTQNRFRSQRFSGRTSRQSRFVKKQEYIDLAFFVKKAVVQEQEVYTPQNQFADFLLCEPLKRNISGRGYVTPTPIQDQAIPALLAGKDVVGLAQTGTGKTAAFLLPLINKVYLEPNQGVIIVAPTRELALQIYEEFKLFARQLDIYSAACIGGVSIFGQKQQLRRRPNFVIGTPGRLKDLEQQRELNFGEYTSIVLDEVDRMLDMGFVKDIEYMIAKLPKQRQSLFFSATMPDKIADLARKFLTNPVTISVRTGKTATNVDQDIVKLAGKQKVEVLHELLIKEGFDKVLVFGRTKWGIEKLAGALEQRGFRVASIHGNKNQNQRQRALEEFKQSRVQILLATDIAARGLDIDNVTHVINFDLPESY